MTGISNKALIWYDNIGLLKPAKVNRENGYRFYDDDNLKQVVDIRFWQEMGFSIHEIANISKDVLENKIAELEKKMDFISSNIELLQKFQEENMEKENITIFNVEEKLVQGKWAYQKTSTDFKDVLDGFIPGEKEKSMPKYLFFGENNVGTDLQDVFGYSDCFTIQNHSSTKNFWYFIVNHRSTLVLYEKPKEENSSEKIKFHIYVKCSRRTYSSKDIQYLCDKYAGGLDACHKPFNQNLVGKFKMYDQILESEMKNYSGKIKTKDACYGLDPIFSILDVQENKDVNACHDVFVMEGGDVGITIKGRDCERTFTRENSVMKLIMCSRPGAEFNIYNFNNNIHRGWYRQVGDEEFLFVDLDCSPDVDEEIYVFKKVKEEDAQ